MNIFDRYLLVNFLKIFLTVTLVSLLLILVYSLTDFFLAFKVTSFEVALKYTTYLMPIGFYVLSPLLINVSALLLLRRVQSKKIDLTAQSFGVSPLRFSLVILAFTLCMCFLFLLQNESFLPKMFRKLWYVEKTFKKKQEVGRLVERLWFVKDTERGKYFVYIDSLDVAKGRFVGLFMLKSSPKGEVLEVVEGRSGTWSENVIYVDTGSAYNFGEGYFVPRLVNFSLRTEIGLKEVGLFAEKIEHVSASSLITLYLKGSRLGLDTNRYLSELLYRMGMSLLPLMVLIPLIFYMFKYRSFRIGFLSFLIHLVIGWIVAVSPKVLAEKANLPPQYALIGYAFLLLYLSKRVYDLGKGLRV